MVKLTRIYTRTGDHGRTRLVDNSVADKTDSRIEAYGTVDELNAVIGLALAQGLPPAVADVLGQVQQELFDLGADLANPVGPESARALRVDEASIARLEGWCDAFGESLPALQSFVLPGGSVGGAALHVARTVCRRAERAAWRAAAEHGLAGDTAATNAQGQGGVNRAALTYLNRLSDLLFILSRVVTGTAGEILWVPGGLRGCGTVGQ